MIIIMVYLLTDSPEKLKLEKIHGTLVLFYVKLSSPQFQRLFFFYSKRKRRPLFSASDRWENTKSSFK